MRRAKGCRWRIIVVATISFRALLWNVEKVLEKELEKADSKSNNEKSKLGDGCYHIFLDVGSNIGVHTRFLFEPDLYPNAKTSLSIFEKEFGVHRNNTDICAFGFEPNPVHEMRQKMLMNEYEKLGWRYHYIQAGASDEDGYMSFYRQGDEAYNEWGFTSNYDIPTSRNGLSVNVSMIRLATWLRDEIIDRKIPDTVYGEYNTDPKIVMKMDIESSEYKVLPDLMVTGILCNIDFLFMEIHDWPINYDADPISGRGELHLQRGQSRKFLLDYIKMFNSLKDCATRIQEADDEAYLHDGMPFPSALPSRIDVFGFHLQPKHFAIILLFISLTMGTVGLGLFVFALCADTYYQRQSSSSSGGGEGSSKWVNGKAVGSNIKGVGDLPKPKSGG